MTLMTAKPDAAAEGRHRLHRRRGRHHRPRDPRAGWPPWPAIALQQHRAGAAQGRRRAKRALMRARPTSSCCACPTRRRRRPWRWSTRSAREAPQDRRRQHRAPRRAGLGLRLRRSWTPGQAAAIARRRRVSNPGCYPTGAIALIRPLVEAGLMPADYPVTVNAVSGYSGGGTQHDRGLRGRHGAGLRALRPRPRAQARAGAAELCRADAAADLRARRSAISGRACW